MTKKPRKYKIGYYGLEQSFSYLTALKRFGPSHKYISQPTIFDAFDNLLKDNVEIIVVPIENSTGGIVYDTVDELVSDRISRSEVKIEEEIYTKIVLNLLSKTSLSKIEKVYVHPFSYRFCRIWLLKNLPQAQIIEVKSTSEAAKRASSQENTAAIASLEAGKTYKLNIIAKNIGAQTFPNITSFFILSKQKISDKKKNKTAVAFAISHQPGALYQALGVFAKAKINLTRIESRPDRKKVGRYKFFAEFEGSLDNEEIKASLKKLEKKTIWMQVISSYASFQLK